jgi:hypothetical protein
MLGVDWAAVEAIAVVASVMVALGLALAPAWNQRRKRPKLSQRISKIEPHCVAIAGENSMVEKVVLRIEICNDGKTAARDLTAKVTGHWIKDLPVVEGEHPAGLRPYKTEGWRLRDTEPVALRWASGSGVTIAPGQSEFACLVALQTRDGELSLCLLDPGTVTRSLGRGLARHRFRVVVYASEGEPLITVVEFVIDGKNFISEVSIADVPKDAEDTRLLTLLRRMAESPDELITPPPNTTAKVEPPRD